MPPRFTPDRRALLGGIATAAVLGTAARAQARPVRIGYSISKTGPNAGGANTTTLPNYQLWARTVNEAGGLRLPDGQRRPIELIEYDDRSQSEEAVRNVDRLINQDRADLVLPPWGTALNLAVGPVLNRAGYPHLAVTSVTDRIPELVQRWPNAFFFLGRSSAAAEALVSALQGLRQEHGLGSTVALVSVQDQFGIELMNAGRAALNRAGFRILMDRQYPLGSQDLSPIIAEAARANPEIFIAFSYPPDTLALTEQARIANFNPKVFYTAVGTAFPLFRQRFGNNAEGVTGIGGVDTQSPAIRDYIARHTQVIGRPPDGWASPVTYASLQVLEQAIAQVGVDRPALIRAIASGTFETVIGTVRLENNQRVRQWWVGQWQGGEFVAVGPPGVPGVQPIRFPKPAWGAA
ncbi:amino acid ABC transporter substrate-binding protein [Caldovatus aquaticus]|uniref:Amino acid ABC transporter substrate-binding protein n=1 Tax=Caldovatus aquaticus TaxID=2865671 RepID=A0ABS7EZJ5_9PROT|nr:amino acid ABC transporter substrate-binding protein [Caldovatus aquaticus]MBW8267955.1 amino acid ABC transporter substrate-binding protein [Caldovatus aquaticus]